MKISKILMCLSWAVFLLCSFSNNHLEAVWTPPVTLSTVDSDEAEIGIDGSGNAVAIWHEFDGVNTKIQAATLPKGGVWSLPVTISSVIGENFEAHPQIAVNASGYSIVVWAELNGTSVVRSSTMQFGGSWSAPVDVSVPTAVTTQLPQVALDPAGNAVAVWVRNDGTFDIVQAATLPFGGSWTTPVNLSPANTDSSNPHVRVDSSGNAVSIWAEIDDQIIQGAALPFGGSWTAFVNISSVSDQSSLPHLAVDPAGNAVAVWTAFSGGDFTTQASTRPFGGSWASPTTLSVITGTFEADVAVDLSGNAIALWPRIEGPDVIIRAAMLPFGGSWSSHVSVSLPGGRAFDPKVALDASGNAIAVWDRFNGVNTTVQAARLPFGGSWSLPVDISPAGQNSDVPQIAMDPTGYAVVDWTNETLGVIQAAEWINEPPPSPPVPPVDFIGVIKKSEFLNKTEYILKATWNPSPSANVLFYRIYKKGIIVATVLANTRLVFEVPLHCHSAKEYEIAAVGFDNLESSHVKIRIVHEKKH